MTKLKINQDYQVAPKQVNLTTLKTKAQLNSIIVDRYGRPDYLAINLYWDSLRSWYNPKIPYTKDGNVYYLSKLQTKGIFLTYKKLAKAHGCSTETVRQKMVKLEQLGLIQRSFQHKETVTTKSYNKLIVYVWKDTPHFYNNFGTDYEKIELNPHTNHEYIAEKYKKKFAENLPQEHAISGGGGIQVSVDTKELNNYSSKEEYRSNAHARKELNPNLNISNSNNPTCFNKELQSDTTESADTKKMVGKEKKVKTLSPSPKISGKGNNEINQGEGEVFNLTEKKSKTVVFPRKKYQKPKALSDMLPILTDRICQEIIAKSGRFDFNSNFIRQLVMKLAKVSKHAHFFSLKGFIIYMSKRVREELRDAVKCSNDRFRFKCNIEDDKVGKEVSSPPKNSNTKTLGKSPQRKKFDPLLDLPNTLLGKIRRRLIELYEDNGVVLDGHWFSKMQPVIDEREKTFKLSASSEVTTDWIKNNCWQRLKVATASVGLKLVEV